MKIGKIDIAKGFFFWIVTFCTTKSYNFNRRNPCHEDGHDYRSKNATSQAHFGLVGRNDEVRLQEALPVKEAKAFVVSLDGANVRLNTPGKKKGRPTERPKKEVQRAKHRVQSEITLRSAL